MSEPVQASDKDATIAKQAKLIKALEAALMNYIGKSYHITGLLSASTTFSLSIEGAFGKEELDGLCRRLALDASLLGDEKITTTKSIPEIFAEIRSIINQTNGPQGEGA